MNRLDSLSLSPNDLNHYPKCQKGEKQDHLNLIIHVTFGSLIHLKPASFRLDVDLNVCLPLQVFLTESDLKHEKRSLGVWKSGLEMCVLRKFGELIRSL